MAFTITCREEEIVDWSEALRQIKCVCAPLKHKARLWMGIKNALDALETARGTKREQLLSNIKFWEILVLTFFRILMWRFDFKPRVIWILSVKRRASAILR